MNSRFDDWHPKDATQEPTYSVTVYLAAPGTPLVDSDTGRVAGTSTAGHMYYSISDGTQKDGYGFSPIGHGDTRGPGQVVKNEYKRYQDPAYARTMEISREQYDTLRNYGEKAVRGQPVGFDLEYGGVKNSCIDFTWAGLNQAGIHSRHAMSFDHQRPYSDKSFEGDIKVLNNLDELRSIPAPVPNSPHNREETHPIPERTKLQKLLSEDGERINVTTDQALLVTDPTHRGHSLYQQAQQGIDRSVNIAPGTFNQEQVQYAAASLAATSQAQETYPGTGHKNERLDRIDAVVFNKDQTGLIAVQGPLGDPAGKLAAIPAAQAVSASVEASSQSLQDNLQQLSLAQAQARMQQLNPTPPDTPDGPSRGALKIS